jgi:hypothetical protein
MTPRTRLRILALVLVIPFVVVGLRLLQFQVLEADRYLTLSIDRRRVIHLNESKRGRIQSRLMTWSFRSADFTLASSISRSCKSPWGIVFARGPIGTTISRVRRSALVGGWRSCSSTTVVP